MRDSSGAELFRVPFDDQLALFSLFGFDLINHDDISSTVRHGIRGFVLRGRGSTFEEVSVRGVLGGAGFQDPQHFCDRLGVLMRAVARRDDVFALRAVQV
jgi:hypothetical protein